jgi:hypothetical protein
MLALAVGAGNGFMTRRHRSTSITIIRQAFAYRMSVFSRRRAKNGVFDTTVTKPCDAVLRGSQHTASHLRITRAAYSPRRGRDDSRNAAWTSQGGHDRDDESCVKDTVGTPRNRVKGESYQV